MAVQKDDLIHTKLLTWLQKASMQEGRTLISSNTSWYQPTPSGQVTGKLVCSHLLPDAAFVLPPFISYLGLGLLPQWWLLSPVSESLANTYVHQPRDWMSWKSDGIWQRQYHYNVFFHQILFLELLNGSGQFLKPRTFMIFPVTQVNHWHVCWFNV